LEAFEQTKKKQIKNFVSRKSTKLFNDNDKNNIEIVAKIAGGKNLVHQMSVGELIHS